MSDTTRQEHLEWSKRRALEYVERGDFREALASMTSDLIKHPETQDHAGIQLGMMQMIGGHLDNPKDSIRNHKP